jgi:hypothetical protein
MSLSFKMSHYSVYSSFTWHCWCRKFVTTLWATFFPGICILQKSCKLMLLVQQNTFLTSTNNLLCIDYNTTEQPHHIPAHTIELRLSWLTLPNKVCIFPPSMVTDYRHTLWKQNTSQIKLKEKINKFKYSNMSLQVLPPVKYKNWSNFEDCILQGYNEVWLDTWILTFQGNVVASKHQERISQGCNVISLPTPLQKYKKLHDLILLSDLVYTSYVITVKYQRTSIQSLS